MVNWLTHVLDWLRRKKQRPPDLKGYSSTSDIEPTPPSYEVERITVEGHRLRIRNRQAVELLAALILNHAEKLGVSGRIRAADRDAYVIGYLAGVIDALAQNCGIDDSYQRTGMLERLYAIVFSRGMQSGALNWFLQQQDVDAVIQGAMQDGGDDYLAFLSGEIRTFENLLRYLTERT